MILFVLTVTAAFFWRAKAADLSDFSNNLATDLGPLLALFGDTMTKQYLSESTSYLDYFIFSMAPIGIISAIISTIRLCGQSSLRAFIGRSREGDAVVEAELCTSTSRDVCELFTKGGITRVFGRPQILELVYDPNLQSQNPHSRTDKAGLFLSRHYFATVHRLETPGSDRSAQDTSFAPNPNISLNAGIKRQPSWMFYIIAVVGFFSQAGVLVLASVGVWKLDWTKEEGNDVSADYYAPIMFIVGTMIMCGGMWSCAALIGQTTREIHIKLDDPEKPQPARLLWIQPGPQIIGDQSFDAFAYLETKSANPLRFWTSSKKEMRKQFEVYTAIAVVATLLGSVLQFIGSRAMKAWVAIAQLCVTVLMSFMRGLLRMKRLSREDNELAAVPDLITGHEIDWLSLNMLPSESKDSWTWQLTGQYQDARLVPLMIQSGSERTKNDEDLSSEKSHERTSRTILQDNDRIRPIRNIFTNNFTCNDLLRLRTRLAHLTGHTFLEKLDEIEYHFWNDDSVKVRSKAKEVAAAILQVADNMCPFKKENEILLQIQASSASKSTANHDQQMIGVTLKPPSEHSQAGWRIDTAKIEAILGLWMWSMLFDERVMRNVSENQGSISEAGNVDIFRIMSIDTDTTTWFHGLDIQNEMNLWLGDVAVNFQEDTLLVDENDSNSHQIPIFSKHVSSKVHSSDGNSRIGDVWKPFTNGNEIDVGSSKRLVGSFGSIYDFRDLRAASLIHSNPIINSDETLQVGVKSLPWPKRYSLLDTCAQELFVVLLASLADVLALSETEIIQRGDWPSRLSIKLRNKSLDYITKAFTRHGLGTRTSALLCVVPSLREKMAPDQDALLSGMTKLAHSLNCSSKYDQAEQMVHGACARFSPSMGRSGDSAHRFVVALCMTGELYRWALQPGNNSEKLLFGIAGYKRMIKAYKTQSDGHPEPMKVLKCYQDLLDSVLGRILLGSSWTQGLPNISIKDMLCRMDQSENMYCLYFLDGVRTPGWPEYLAHAASNNWVGLIYALLDSVYPPLRGSDFNTTMRWAIQRGHTSLVRALIEREADINATPSLLAEALKEGKSNIFKMLLELGVDTELQDEDGFTTLAIASFSGLGLEVEKLIQYGANVQTRSKGGATALLRAARKGRTEIVRRLLAAGADVNTPMDDGSTPIIFAELSGHHDIVRQLLHEGADKDPRESGSWSLLFSVVYCTTSERLLKAVLSKDQDLEKKDSFGRTVLRIAAEKNKTSFIKILLQNGAYLRKNQFAKSTPLDDAVLAGSEDAACFILDSSWYFEKNMDFSRILWRAVTKRMETLVPRLLKHVDANDFQLRHLLHEAIGVGSEKITNDLLLTGAKVEEQYRGITPLCQAATLENIDVVERLLESGANANAADESGITPLFHAIEEIESEGSITPVDNKSANEKIDRLESRLSIITILLRNGADPLMRDSDGQSLWDIVQRIEKYALDPRVSQVAERIFDMLDEAAYRAKRGSSMGTSRYNMSFSESRRTSNYPVHMSPGSGSPFYSVASRDRPASRSLSPSRSPSPPRNPPPVSQSLVLASQSLVLASQSHLPNPQAPEPASQSPSPASRSLSPPRTPSHASQSLVPASQSLVLASKSPVQAPQGLLPASQSPSPASLSPAASRSPPSSPSRSYVSQDPPAL